MIVDRIEGNQAVVELAFGSYKNVPLSQIRGRVRDGAVLRQTGADAYEVDERATSDATARISEKTKGLFI
jgi:limonene-1,2-epoxide hydrolase